MSVRACDGTANIGRACESVTTSDGNAGAPLLPVPFSGAGTDDIMTALAILMMKQKHEERVAGDSERQSAAKAQEAAHERKIETMRALANDEFAAGLVGGLFDAGSAG